MKSAKKYLFIDSFFCLLLTIIFLWLISFVVLNLSVFNPFTGAFKDFSFLDIYYSEKMEINNPSKDIVIINIEKKSRFEINQLVNKIKQEKPKVIGVDIIFKNQKDPYVDSLLSKSLNEKNIILSKAFINERWVTNTHSFIKDSKTVGYTNINFNKNSNVIRTFEGKKKINDSIQYSISVLIAKKYMANKWDTHIESITSKEVPINYYGNIDSFLHLSYDDCIEQEDLSILKDKIILLGYLGTPHESKTDIEDKLYTPLNKKIAGKSPPDMFGVIIHANIIQMLISQSFYKVIPKWLIIILALIISYFSIAFFIVCNTKYPAGYTFIKKIIQLFITIILLWLSLWLFKNKILFKPELIIVFLIISVELIGTYKIISKKLNSKYKWKSYFFQ